MAWPAIIAVPLLLSVLHLVVRAAAAAAASSGSEHRCGVCNPEEYVNTLGGTNSSRHLSHGNVLPLVVRPWGMNAWSPVTRRQTPWWFHPDHRAFYGVRCTHQPSPWMGDYGPLVIAASLEDVTEEHVMGIQPDKFSSIFHKLDQTPFTKLANEQSSWKPYLWQATLRDMSEEDHAIKYDNPYRSSQPTPFGRNGPTIVYPSGARYPPTAVLVKTKTAKASPLNSTSATTSSTTRTTTSRTSTTTTSSFPSRPSQDGTKLELTSTSRAAVMRVTFPAVAKHHWRHQRYRIEVLLNDYMSDSINASMRGGGRPALFGRTKRIAGGLPERCENSGTATRCGTTMSHFFYLTVESCAGAPIDKDVITLREVSEIRASVDIDPRICNGEACALLVRIGTSFISPEQAALNHGKEVDAKPFDQLVSESKMEWRDVLRRVDVLEVGDSYSEEERDGLLEVLYSSLYRATQFPRLLHEETEVGHKVHFSPYDLEGRVLPGIASTDIGFWDGYRTVFPLLSLLYPEKLGQLVHGFVTAWEESGWLPKWPSPGERGGMEGTLGDVVLADAIAKGIPGFNRSAAYEAIRQDAFVVPHFPKRKSRYEQTAPGRGRRGLQGYMDIGYIPTSFMDTAGHPVGDTVSRTLDYLLADNAIAHAAEAMGFEQDAKVLRSRAAKYGKLFDNKTGFFRARSLKGDFSHDPHWNKSGQYAWGTPYLEGGPWQYRFNVPWDPQGLARLFQQAGLDMCDELEKMMVGPTHFGPYQGMEVIHEQTEMKVNCWGQYSHNNQPVHHVLYMFGAAAGSFASRCASRGQSWLRKALLQLYRPGAAMYSGDEDNGEMGAWFVLSALGLYLLEPGSPSYAIGSPLFGRVILRPQGRSELEIVADGNARDSPYIAAASFQPSAGGKLTELDRPEVGYDDLARGGTLRFEMSHRPDAHDLQQGHAFVRNDEWPMASAVAQAAGGQQQMLALFGGPMVVGLVIGVAASAGAFARWPRFQRRIEQLSGVELSFINPNEDTLLAPLADGMRPPKEVTHSKCAEVTKGQPCLA